MGGDRRIRRAGPGGTGRRVGRTPPSFHEPVPFRSRSGGIALSTAMFLGLALLCGGFIMSQTRRSFTSQLQRSLVVQELDHLTIEALEEGHYRLAMGVKPRGSARAAAAEVAAAARSRSGNLSPEADLSPGDECDSLDHDTPGFLREGTGVLELAPATVGRTASAGDSLALGAVTVTVKDRTPGRLIQVPHGQDLDPTHHELADLGLPPGVVAYRSTWGVLELSCEATRSLGRARVTRQAVQRRLFAVIDYQFFGEDVKSYAHIFPEPIGQIVKSRGGGVL